MTDQEPDKKLVKQTPERGFVKRHRIGSGLVVGGVVLAVGLGGIYLNRAVVADKVLVGWLERQGIRADVDVERFEWDGFTGRITIGDPADPDVRIDRVEVDYAIGLPWMRGGAGVTPRRVLLSRPLVKAQWIDGQFSLGSLDPLIAQFTSKPPTGDKAGPLIIVEKGEARLTTDYGPVTILADARIDDGRLKSLSAQLPELALAHADLNASGLVATLQANDHDGRLVFSGQAQTQNLIHKDIKASALNLVFHGAVPYPQKGATKAQGPVLVTASLQGDTLAMQGFSGRQISTQLDWRGQIDGWFDSFVLSGQGQVNGGAHQLVLGDNHLSDAQVKAARFDLIVTRKSDETAKSTLHWKADGPVEIIADQARLAGFDARQITLRAANLSAGGRDSTAEIKGDVDIRATSLIGADLALRGLNGRAHLDLVRDADFKIDVRAGLSASNGAYLGLGRPTAGDGEEIAALKAAAADFSLSAPEVRFVMGSQHSELDLVRPLVLRPRRGGEVVLSRAKGVVFEQAGGRTGGAAELVMRGGDLPNAQLDIARWSLSGGGITASLNAKVKSDFAMAKGIDLETAGQFAVRNGIITYQDKSCARLGVTRLDMGETSLENISGRLCPTTLPMFRMAQGRWDLNARVDGADLAAPFAQAQLSGANGPLRVTGANGAMGVNLGIERSRLSDTGEVTRFNPLNASGALTMASDIWRGQFALFSSEPAQSAEVLANLCLVHNGPIAVGGLGIVTPGMDCVAPSKADEALPVLAGGLYFSEHGLQPQALSPLVPDAIGDPVTGRATFAGHMFWNAEGMSSAGHLALADLTFVSPVGNVSGGTGDITMTSLAPLVIPMGQSLRFDGISGPLPMSDVRINLGVEDDILYLQRASVHIAGGEVYLFDDVTGTVGTVLPLPKRDDAGRGVQIPLEANKSWHFGIALDAIQLNELIEAVGAEQKASLDAVVSGILPVTFRPEWGFAISNGVLVADRRGTLAISPEVLGNVDAGVGEIVGSDGEEAKVPRNVMQDLAYQALEHLTFTDLRADVNSVCLPRNEAGRGFVDPSIGQLCHTLPVGQDASGPLQWIPSRLAVDFAINGYYDPPERKEMRLSIIDVLRRNFFNKKMVLPSDTPVTLGLKTSINAYDLASQVMDYVRMRNNPPESP